ncbi:MAG: ABC transporter permease [Chitinophagales bacterium]
MARTIISSKPDTLLQYLEKIWVNKSLILTLARRDLKAKYAQTILGLAWTIVQPLTAVVIYTLFFSVLLKFETEYPYVLFVLSGILLWGLFNYIFAQGSTAVQQNQDLVQKLYFPKLILPLSKVLVALVEFAAILLFFIGLLIVFQVNVFSWKLMLTLPIFGILIIFSLGLALILGAATAKNRDLNHIIPFLVNFGIWVTPVFYPVTVIPEQYKNLLYINPMATLIQLFRWCLFDEPISIYAFLGIGVAFLIFLIGFFFFKKVEDKMIDVL